jgi:hypothetical protein
MAMAETAGLPELPECGEWFLAPIMLYSVSSGSQDPSARCREAFCL